MSIILNIRNNITQRKLCVNDRRYAWPEPFKSDIDFDRFNGADIEDMSELEKWMELKRLESVLAWLDEKAILIVDLSSCPARVVTKRAWGLERMKKLKRGAA